MFTNVTLLYFLLLIPLSGFIAWVGDRIGHKSGKRRHTLFGLRPRHTAMVFTIGTGVCICLVSFGLMWAVSKSFRVVMSEGINLVHKNRDLKTDNKRLAVGNDALRGEKQSLAEQAGRSREQAKANAGEAHNADKRRDKALQQARTAEKQAQEALAQAKKAESAAISAKTRLTQETQALRRAKTKLIQAGQNLALLKSSLTTKAGELRTAQNKVRQAEEQVGVANTRVASAKSDASKAVKNLAQVRGAAEQALTLQRDNLSKLRDQLTEQTRLFDEQSKGIAEQRTALAQLKEEVSRGRQELAGIQESVGALRGRQITYQVGEEVDRVAIRSGYNVWRIEAILGSFLSAAAKRAEARGAGRSKGRDAQAVVILPKMVAGDGAEDNPRVVNEEESVKAAAAAIRKSNTDVVVLANATANAVAGEPVAIEFKIFKNPVVFTVDTPVGEAAIDGNGTRQEVADALFAFLHQKVRRTLLQAGIIPPARGGDSDTTNGSASPLLRRGDGGDENGEALISLSGDEWLRIMDKVREAGGNARVVARAARDLRAGDTVVLRFDVKGAAGGNGAAQSAILRPSGL